MNYQKYCENSFCPQKDLTSRSLPFACEFCRTRLYCSKNCQLQDWNMGHDKVCESILRDRIAAIEKTCPFLTGGIILSPTETKGMFSKVDVLFDKYEKVNVEGKGTSVLGKGSYGKVFLMRQKDTHKLVAMKIIEKKYIGNSKAIKALTREIEIHKSLLHENIIRLFEHCEDSQNIYLCMEYASKGSLFQYIRAKGKLSEKEVFYFFSQACNAVNFLHKHHLMHRDIKPENILIMQNGQLKLCDFGCCTPCSSDGRRTFCGTIEYMAPEILKRDGYKEKADVWSLGVLLYEMIHGYAPFHGRRDQDTMSKIIENRLTFSLDIKEDLKELIGDMLQENPMQRPYVVELFEKKWIKRLQKEYMIKDRECKENIEVKDKKSKEEKVQESNGTFKVEYQVNNSFVLNETGTDTEKVKPIEEIRAELYSKLLTNVPSAGVGSEEEANTSFTSDDYALQRSESLLKAVCYLDDLDCGALPEDLDRRVKEIEHENHLLKIACGRILPQQQNEKLDTENILDEIPREVLYGYPAKEYKQSMGNIAKALIDIKSDCPSSKPAPRTSVIKKVQLITTHKSVNANKEPKKQPRKSFWSFLFSFDDNNGL